LSEKIYSQLRAILKTHLGKHLVGSYSGRYRQACLLLYSCSQLRDDFAGRHPCPLHIRSDTAYQPLLRDLTYFRYPSSRLAMARFGSYSANTDRISLEVDTYRSKWWDTLGSAEKRLMDSHYQLWAELSGYEFCHSRSAAKLPRLVGCSRENSTSYAERFPFQTRVPLDFDSGVLESVMNRKSHLRKHPCRHGQSSASSHA